MEALILVATSGGPTVFVRIGVVRALIHGKPVSGDSATPQPASPPQLTLSARHEWSPKMPSSDMAMARRCAPLNRVAATLATSVNGRKRTCRSSHCMSVVKG